MSLSGSGVGSFSDLKELLSGKGCDYNHDESDIPHPVRDRAWKLCSTFLGGPWKTVRLEDMKLRRMVGGTSNMLFLCQLRNSQAIKTSDEIPNKVLIRIYFNPETESHLVAESVIFTLLSERKLGPRLYGIFNGGRLEEYIVSRPLTCKEIRQPDISKRVAQKLAGVHQLSVPIKKEPTYIFEAIERWLAQVTVTTDSSKTWRLTLPSTNKVMIVDTSILNRELGSIRAFLATANSPVAFCHNDLQEGNILSPQGQSAIGDTAETEAVEGASQQDLVLIDFEYASYNYRAFDFANHFIEWTIDYNITTPPYYAMDLDNFPSVDEQKTFLKSYLECFDDGKEENLDGVLREIKGFVPISHFLWGVWGLLQVQLSPVQFGFEEYAKNRLALYYDNKSHMMSALRRRASWSGDGGEMNGAQIQDALSKEKSTQSWQV